MATIQLTTTNYNGESGVVYYYPCNSGSTSSNLGPQTFPLQIEDTENYEGTYQVLFTGLTSGNNQWCYVQIPCSDCNRPTGLTTTELFFRFAYTDGPNIGQENTFYTYTALDVCNVIDDYNNNLGNFNASFTTQIGPDNTAYATEILGDCSTVSDGIYVILQNGTYVIREVINGILDPTVIDCFVAPTATPTPTPTGAPLATDTPTPTPAPATATPTPTPTATPTPLPCVTSVQFEIDVPGEVRYVDCCGTTKYETFGIGPQVIYDCLQEGSLFQTTASISFVNYDTNPCFCGGPTDTPTPTPIPPTETPTPTPTGVPSTGTPTPTPQAATATPTPTPQAATATPTPTGAPTGTPTPTSIVSYPYQIDISGQYFNRYDACLNQTVNYTVYSAYPSLSIGDILYTDPNLTSDYYGGIGNYFIIEDASNKYVIDTQFGSGINSITNCVDVYAPTATPTPTPTGAPATSTPTPTPTGAPATSTPTPTPIPATSTPTPTPVPPTATPTSTPPPPSPTPTVTPTSTATPVPPTETPTPTPTSTPTSTPQPPTATPTPTPTATPTPTPCPAYGTLLYDYCEEYPTYNRIGVYTNGSCGTYTEVIAYRDPTCGYVPEPTVTPTPTATATPTPTPTPVPVESYFGSGYGGSTAAACNDAGINNRTLYSDCDSGSFGVGCYVYVDTFPNPLTGSTNVFMNSASWNINPISGQVQAYSTEQC